MALRPIPPRDESETEQARFAADMKHFNENPAAWCAPSGLLDPQARQTLEKIGQENAAVEAALAKPRTTPVEPDPTDPQPGDNAEEPAKRGPGRPRKNVA